jgi:hypothetical protein
VADVVGADLVPETARARVDHHTELARVDPEPFRRCDIVDLVDDLHLDEVVAGAEAAHLSESTLTSPSADLGRVGTGDHAAVLAPRQIPWRAMPPRHGVGGAAEQDLVELAFVLEVPGTPLAHPAHDPLVEFVTQPLASAPEVPLFERGRQEPDTAGDVEPDPARRHHAARLDVGGGDAPDREPVAPVHVGHGVAGLHDPRQRGDVGDLGQRGFRVA